MSLNRPERTEAASGDQELAQTMKGQNTTDITSATSNKIPTVSEIPSHVVDHILQLYSQLGKEPPPDLWDTLKAPRVKPKIESKSDCFLSLSPSNLIGETVKVKDEPLESSKSETIDISVKEENLSPVKIVYSEDNFSEDESGSGNTGNGSASESDVPKMKNVSSMDSLVSSKTKKRATSKTVAICPERVNCRLCNEEITRDQLKKHFNHCHSTQMECIVCEKTFHRLADTLRHLWLHTGYRPFKCPKCGLTFPLKGALAHHKRTHSEELPFGCNECGKRFKKNGSLKMHSLTHTKERAFACNICGKTFNRGSSLKAHILSHTKQMKYACPYCPATRLTKYDVQRHMRTHTGEKPFECSLCGKTMAWGNSYRSHMKSHKDVEEGLKFECVTCQKFFTSEENYNRHKATHESS